MPRRGAENLRPLEAQRMPPDMVNDRGVARAVQEIDAAFFSGDTFLQEDNLAHIMWYLERWQRAAKGCATEIQIEEEIHESMLDQMIRNSKKV